MKNLKFCLSLLAASAAFVLVSCSDDDSNGNLNPIVPPTSEEFKSLYAAALDNHIQTFTLSVNETGVADFTSDDGVEVTLNTNCLQINGMPVTGTIDVEFIELYDRANLLTTGVGTMGTHPDGTMEMLVSGGAFYVQILQNGVAVDPNSCGYTLRIPTTLTGGMDTEMLLWYGVEDENGNLIWEDANNEQGQGGGIETSNGLYWVWASQFGWTNVDRFYSDPRPKTTIFVGVPNGYDVSNSDVFLSYDGEETALARLDTYDEETGLFSEHYGLIPIGLECHVIFVSEHNGQWVYAIKPYTVAEDGMVTISANDLATSTESGLTTLINNLP